MDNVDEIYVYENWKSNIPSLIGTLYVEGGRGKQIVLNPDLGMFRGRQYAPADKLMFGVFEDSCPDRIQAFTEIHCH